MIVTLKEIKNYLRVDHDEDDKLIKRLIHASEELCMDVARIDDPAKYAAAHNAKVAVMYAVAYMYEHREEADHHELALNLRALLFGIREAAF